MSGPEDKGPERDAEDEVVSTNSGLILPGGKVDPDAIRRAVEKADPEVEDDAELRRVTFTIQRDLKKRLDKYLTDRITFMSRSQLQRLIEGGGVLVNDRAPKASTVLRRGDVVEVVVPSPPARNIQPEDIPLEVLFEDEHLIVLNKQPDIIVHPARSHLKGTMLSALAYHFAHRSTLGGGLSGVGDEFARPGVVHRLDRHTSGCIVFAKQDEAHWKLGHQFEHRRVDKRYLAVVEGKVEPVVEVIELPLGPHPSREKGYREKFVVRHDEQGKHAVTICRVRERYAIGRSDGETERRGDEARKEQSGPSAAGARLIGAGAAALRLSASPSLRHFSLVELELKTGRTHQIRVHLSHLGWPIVGDDMYGGIPFEDDSGRVVIARQALHAALLGFTHPVSGGVMEFTAPLREDIADLVRTLRRMSGERHQRVQAAGASVNLEKAIG